VSSETARRRSTLRNDVYEVVSQLKHAEEVSGWPAPGLDDTRLN
jgi:hypothetical protein